MNIFKIFSLALLLGIAAACTSDPLDGETGPSGKEMEMTFSALSETVVKTSLGSAFDVLWSENDAVQVFSGGRSDKFTIASLSEDGKTAAFTGRTVETGSYYAVYPYSTSNTLKNGVMNLSLQLEQTAVKDGFAVGANVSVAYSTDMNMKFLNLGALVGITVGSDDVKSITLTPIGQFQYLTGNSRVSFNKQGVPVATTTSANKDVVLRGDFEKGATYYFVVYPGSYSGFKITYGWADGKSASLINNKQLSVSRNAVVDMQTITIAKPSEDGPAVNVTSEWAGIADSCTFVLVDQFMNKNKGVFFKTPAKNASESSNLYWQQAHAMDVIVYSYERLKNTDPTLAETYKTYIKRWFDNDANNYNNSKDSEGNYGGFFNAYTDDMCWICLTLLHMTEATGIETYAETAREVFDRYIMPRAYETKDDGKIGLGLPWTNIADKMGRNACTNSPGCLVAAKLYRKYNRPVHLENAKTLYNWVINNLINDKGRVEEPPLTYTQGTFAEACRQLYHITGEQSYMDMAAKVIVFGMTSERCTNKNTGLLRHEGESMDQSIFKAVLIPYAVNFVLDKDAPIQAAATVKERLYLNARALRGSLDKTKYPKMYADYYWGTTYSGADNSASMGAQTSGASLMENVCRMDSALLGQQ